MKTMKMQKQFLSVICILVILISFTQCSSAQKLEEKSSFELGQVTFQRWVAGVQGGGSGYHMLINVILNKNNVTFDSIYFRGYTAKIETGKIAYIANIKTELNQREDIIMSNNSKDEFGNKSPLKEKIIPFKLADNECVISYIEKDITKYFNVDNIIEIPRVEYSSAPPKQP